MLEGCDCEIEIQRDMSEADLATSSSSNNSSGGAYRTSQSTPATRTLQTQIPVVPVTSNHHNAGHQHESATTMTTTRSVSSKSHNENAMNTTTTSAAVATPSSQLPTAECIIIPYDQLIANANTIAGVDPAHKERCLSNVEFGSIFGMSREEFERLPAWKRAALKKKCGLF